MADESSEEPRALGVWQTKLPKAVELMARTLQRRVNAHRVDELSIGEVLMMALLRLRLSLGAAALTPSAIKDYTPMRMPRGNLGVRELTSVEYWNLNRLAVVAQEAIDADVAVEKAEALLARVNALLKANDPY